MKINKFLDINLLLAPPNIRAGDSILRLSRYLLLVFLVGYAPMGYTQLVSDQPFDFSYDYFASGAGEWIVSAPNNIQPGEYTTHWSNSDDQTGNGGGTYVMDIDITNRGFIYLELPFPDTVAFHNSINLAGKIKVTVDPVATTYPNFRMHLGGVLHYPDYGTFNSQYFKHTVDTTSAQWQVFNDSLIASSIDVNRVRKEKNFALSTFYDFLPTSNKIILYIIPPSNQGRLKISVSFDDISINGVTPLLTDYQTEATIRRADYGVRIQQGLDAVVQPINTAYNEINNSPLPNHSPAHGDIVSQASALNAFANTFPPLPSVDQYNELLDRHQHINELNALNKYILQNADKDLLHYPVVATRNHGFLDHQLELKSDDASFDRSPVSTPDNTAAITAKMALGEYEPLSFILQNVSDNGISIESVDLTQLSNQFGQSLAANQLDLRIVKQWYTGSLNNIAVASGQKIIAPEVLLHDDSLISIDQQNELNFLKITIAGVETMHDIATPTVMMPHDAVVEDATEFQSMVLPALNSRQFWLTVHASTGAKPGNYSGNIIVNYRLADLSSGSLSIPVDLTILPLVLQDSALDHGIFYSARIRDFSGLTASHKNSVQYTAEMQNIFDHGVKYPNQYLGSPDNNIAELGLHYGIRENIGFPCDKIFLLLSKGSVDTVDVGNEASVAADVNEVINEMNSILGNCVNPDIYFYGQDEASGSTVTNQLSIWSTAQANGGKIYVAGSVGIFDAINTGVDAAVNDPNIELEGPITDGIIDAINLPNAANDTEIMKWRTANKDVYSYANPQVGAANAEIYRRNFGLYLWQHDYTGSSNFAYQHQFPSNTPWLDPNRPARTPSQYDLSQGKCFSYQLDGYCSLWNDFDSSRFYDHNYTFPTTSGVIDTIQWEGFREGIDDTRYLTTLQQLNENNTNQTLKTEIINWLEQLKVDDDFDFQNTRQTMQNYIATILESANAAPVLSNINVVSQGSQIIVGGEVVDNDNNLAVVELVTDNQIIRLDVSGTWQYTFTNLEDGDYNVAINAIDYWDQSSTEQRSVTVTNIVEAPAISTLGIVLLCLFFVLSAAVILPRKSVLLLNQESTR